MKLFRLPPSVAVGAACRRGVVIADPCAEQVASRLRELGVRIAPDATSFAWEDCVAQLAAWWLEEQASAAIGQLRALAAAQSITDSWTNVALALVWGVGKWGRCEATGAEDDSSGPVAALARVEATDLLLRASPAAPGARDDITGLLRRVSAEPGARRILIEADGSRFPVIEVIDPPRRQAVSRPVLDVGVVEARARLNGCDCWSSSHRRGTPQS